MAEQSDDNLDNLRHRVTCPICHEILNEPKRMPNCSHVFCIGCLTRYLRSKLPANFTTCPVCRKPITISYREINKFEPARAEADIVALVKNFETCGFCNKNKRPNSKCVDCRKFICEKCKSCHEQLKPNHRLEGIILTSEAGRPVSEMCENHKDQTLDLFCIMCQSLLCLYCEKYSHAKCKDKYRHWHVMEQFSTGLLETFVQGSGARKYLFKSGKLERTVYIKEFSSESRTWLKHIGGVLEPNIAFFEDYRLHLENIVDKENSTEAEIDLRRRKVTDEIDFMLQSGKYLQAKCIDLLERSSDTEVARVILDMEQLCSWFVKLRADYFITIRPLKLTLECFGYFRFMLKNVTSCHVEEGPYTFASIISIKRREEEPYYIRSTLSSESSDNAKRQAIRSSLTKKILDRNGSVCYRAVFVDKGNLSKEYYCFFLKNGYHSEFQMALNFSNKCTYIESPVSQSGLTYYVNRYIQSASSQHFGPRAPSCHPCSFYVEKDEDDDPRICFRFGGSHDERFGHLSGSLYYTTHFTNVYGQVLSLPIERNAYSNNEVGNTYLNAITGKTTPLNGLETLFIYFEDDICKIHGISVSSSMTKFKLLDTENQKHQEKLNCHLITDELGIFSMCTTTMENGEVISSSFRTKLTQQQNAENFLSTQDLNIQFTFPLTVASLSVDLLCNARQGLYFVKRGETFDEVIIGRIIENSHALSIEPETICSVKQTDIGNIPIKMIKPLTLTENKNEEMVAVCAVEHTATTFIMIWPSRNGTDSVELFQVEYPTSDTSFANTSVLDLEMDPDGNIMYVVENKTGKTFTVFTKYLM